MCCGMTLSCKTKSNEKKGIALYQGTNERRNVETPEPGKNDNDGRP